MQARVSAAIVAFAVLAAAGSAGLASPETDTGPARATSAEEGPRATPTAVPEHPLLGEVDFPHQSPPVPPWQPSPAQTTADAVEEALASSGFEDFARLSGMDPAAIPTAIADNEGLSLPGDRCSDLGSPSLETAVGALEGALNRSGGLAEDLELAPPAREAVAPLVACIAIHIETMPEIQPRALVQDEETRAGWLAIQRDLLRQLQDLGTIQLSHGPHCLDTGCSIQLGGNGDDVYTDPAILTLDTGGSDTYRNNAGGASPLSTGIPIALALDRGQGNDTYEPELTDTYDYPTLGGGYYGGVGILVDQGGDDRFEAVGTTMGSGFIGAGLLLSEAGDDVYVSPYPEDGGEKLGQSQKVAMGAGAWGGTGVLLDRGGNDSYTQEGVDSLGWGAVGGVGVLLDEEGHDAYVDKPAPTGEIGANASDPDPVSGVSMGTGEVGGVGVLLDDSGDDTYRCEGPVYYGCAGAGTFGVIGLLHDARGDDVYTLEEAYNDTPGFAGGLGGADGGGFGLLVEDEGNDTYTSRMSRTGGYGQAGSGLFLDRSGTDTYDFLLDAFRGQRADGSAWVGQEEVPGSVTGIGYDEEG